MAVVNVIQSLSPVEAVIDGSGYFEMNFGVCGTARLEKEERSMKMKRQH